jgi:tetratricopeptide (TPR) repeat protein
MSERQGLYGRGVLLVLLVLLAGWPSRAAADDPPKESSPEERARLEKQAADLAEQADAHYRQGRYPEATKLLREVLEIRRKLYPARRYPQGHPDLARSLNNLGFMLWTQEEYGPALDYFRQALRMNQQLYPKERYPQGHEDLATSLYHLGALLQAQGQYDQALDSYRQALQMYQGLYPKERYPQGHEDLATTLNNLGGLLQEQREYGQALDYDRQALQMFQQLYPKGRYPQGHPDLAASLFNLGALLKDQGEYAQALGYLKQALDMYQQLYPKERYPQGHPDLARSLDNLGRLLQDQGAYGQALDYLQQALRMRQQLYPEERYPQGHPQLATSLSNLGVLLQDQGEYGQALDYFQQALQMRQQLYPKGRYPKGHAELAESLNGLGLLLRFQGEDRQALDYLQQALHMRQQLYPKGRYPQGRLELAISLTNLGVLMRDQGEHDQALHYFQLALRMLQQLYPKGRYPEGHPELAAGLNNLGMLLQDQREYGQALDYLQQVLQMNRQLYPQERYPQGHPHLATSLNNLGFLLWARGEYTKSLDYFRQALQMYQRLTRAFTERASEAQALNFLASLPVTRDAFLSVAAEVKDASTAAQYALVWDGKANVTGVLARRQQVLRGTTDDKTRALSEEVLDVRRQLARLLLAPADAAIKDRDRRLRELTERRERLERDLARRLPDFQRRETLDRAPYTDLVQHLPAHAAFIDLLHYYHFPRGPKGKPVPHYVAFVLRHGQPVQRVDLGPAPPIEDALAHWRRDLGNGLSSPAAAQLRRLVWEPLATRLGPDTDTVYLSPDGALHALPWAALPGGKPGTFLLEDYVLALVPHGPFLLDQLTAPPRPADHKDTLLAVGGVAYDQEAALQPDIRRAADRGKGQARWPALAGTANELEQVLALARSAREAPAVVARRGREAGTQRVWLDLPRARWAHLATHGFFAAPRTHERQALLREADFLRGVAALERRGVGVKVCPTRWDSP